GKDAGKHHYLGTGRRRCGRSGRLEKDPPQSTISKGSSHRIEFTTSRMCVSRLTSRDRRCERSPTPVSVGVNTSWPWACNSLRTRFQHQLPCHAPWVRTNDVMEGCPSVLYRFAVERPPVARRRMAASRTAGV